MRLFELARELGVPGKELLAKVQKIGIAAKDNFTELNQDQIKKIKQAINEPSSVTSPIRIKASTPGVAKAAGARKVRRKISPQRQEEIKAEAEKAKAEAEAAKVAATKAEEAKLEAIKLEEEQEAAKVEEAKVEAAKEAAKLSESKNQAKAAPANQSKDSDDKYKKGQKPAKKPEPIQPEDDAAKKKHVKKAGHGHKKPKELNVSESMAEAAEVSPSIQTYSATSFSGKHRYNKWNKPGRGLKGKKSNQKKHTFNARKKDLIIGETIQVGELAGLIGIKAGQIIKTLMNLGIMVTVNEFIEAETAQLVAAEYEVEVRVEIKSVEDTLTITEDKDEDLISRAPVVTIMGHVDHGKTSLLDKIRSANVTDGEAGGITQHIGAYSVSTDIGQVCFLDTPGHEAFTAMRARGANATDIVILVVAADDGPRPQTIEAINHSKAAGVPIIVAINKCDKPDGTPDKVVQQLMEHELISEDFGGDTPMIKVSAMTGEGIDKLLEIIQLQAEIMELKSNPKRSAEGVVVESRLDKGRGNICTLLVQNGTLKIGDCYVVGQEYGRVRAMWNDKGEPQKEALPSTPIEIVGLNGLPLAGDTFQVGKDEKSVRQIADARETKAKEKVIASEEVVTLENIFARASEAEKANLNLIIKTDVVGSMEALSDSLTKLGNDEVAVKVIHSAVGGITQTDIALAHASKAIVIGFNVRADNQAKKSAQSEQVEIKQYSIIYECIEDVTKALEGLLQPIVREEFQGKAEVLEVFNIPKIGVIAGTKVIEGKFMRDSPVRVFRDNVMIYEGQLASLKRFKDNAKEVAAGFECGIGIQSYKDLRSGDTLESFQRIETAAKL